jgi:hypothetical protein
LHVLWKSDHKKPHISCYREWNYLSAGTVKPYNLLKVKNESVKFACYAKVYTIFNVVPSWECKRFGSLLYDLDWREFGLIGLNWRVTTFHCAVRGVPKLSRHEVADGADGLRM